MRKTHQMLFGLAIGAACAAGGAAPPPQAKAEPMDACALLNPSEITAVINVPVEAGVRRDIGAMADGTYGSTCLWTVRLAEPAPENPAAPLGGKSFVILNVIRWPAGAGLAHTFLDSFRSAAQRGELPAPPSPRKFGDDALWWGDGLAIARKDVAFGISVFIPASKPARPGIREEQLAPRILARLDQVGTTRHD